LEQKKGELKLIRAKNMKILYKNILCKEIEDLVPKYSIDAPLFVVLLLLFFRQVAYFSISDLEPMVFCATL